jgi:hypothetical protein
MSIARAALVFLCLTLDAIHASERSNSEGQSLAAELQSLRPETNLVVRGMIRVRDGSGNRKAFPFRLQITLEEKRWTSVYEAQRPDGSTLERLAIVHEAGRANRYSLSRRDRPDGALHDAVPVTGGQLMTPFAETDFWLADLGRDFVFWPEQRIVEEAKIRMRKSRPCRVLESRNPGTGATGYTRVRSWIDRESGGVILAEAFGPDDKLMKEFEVGGVTRVNGRYELKKLEMRDARTDSKTVFEFHYDQPE